MSAIKSSVFSRPRQTHKAFCDAHFRRASGVSRWWSWWRMANQAFWRRQVVRDIDEFQVFRNGMRPLCRCTSNATTDRGAHLRHGEFIAADGWKARIHQLG